MPFQHSSMRSDDAWTNTWKESVRRILNSPSPHADVQRDTIKEVAVELILHYLPTMRRVIYNITQKHAKEQSSDLIIDILDNVMEALPDFLDEEDLDGKLVALCFASVIMFEREQHR